MFGSNSHFRSLGQDFLTKSDQSEDSTTFGLKLHSSLDLLHVVAQAEVGVEATHLQDQSLGRFGFGSKARPWSGSYFSSPPLKLVEAKLDRV